MPDHRKEARSERVGHYVVSDEVGRGSFATVYKGWKIGKEQTTLAIKAVSRQKLTARLLDSLESEINILKAMNHRNIVSMTECFKNDTHIYIVMEYCSGADLSIYMKNRGRIESLDFVPRFFEKGMVASQGGKVFWPHPLTGGLDERVTRCFLGQLANALRFLRTQNLIHRDIKPQNLLLQPATATDLAEGHPLGIPVLKVADFGFARILPHAALAETLCGSPLYMAPEILRYEKYDAKADLWSVGAVLFEMVVGRAPFRAANHVELGHKIERNADRIKFPDESSRAREPAVAEDGSVIPPPLPVSADIKALIRALLKRHQAERMGFEDFFASGVWEGYMTEAVGDGSTSLDVSTDSSAVLDDSRKLGDSNRLAESAEAKPSPPPTPSLAVRPKFQVPPFSTHPSDRAVQSIARPAVRRSEPKYYVGDEPSQPPTPTVASTPAQSRPATVAPRPIDTRPNPPIRSPPLSRPRRDSDERAAGSGSPTPVPPAPAPAPASLTRAIGGSPLAATPPITMTGKDESALAASDSVGQEYVVVEKRTVEINELADEVEQRSRPPTISRPSSHRPSIVSRPVSAFKPSTSAPAKDTSAIVPASYSPPFAFGTTPPFSFQAALRQPIARPAAVAQAITGFTPSLDGLHRLSSSPSSFQSLQTGPLARALSNTARRLIESSAGTAATSLARNLMTRATGPTVLRATDPDEADLLEYLEDMARKVFALYDLADSRLSTYARSPHAAPAPPFGLPAALRRKSSSSSPREGSLGAGTPSRNFSETDLELLRAQEAAAGEACALYFKALAYVCTAHDRVKRYWDARRFRDVQYETSADLSDMVQWMRARFNDLYEKAEWAKARCAEELPFVERLVYDRAAELARHAAVAEVKDDLASAEQGYELALWLLGTQLDDLWHDGQRIDEAERRPVDELMAMIRRRSDGLRARLATAA